MKRSTSAIAGTLAAVALTLTACAPDIRQIAEEPDDMSGAQSGLPISGGQSDQPVTTAPTLDDERIARIVADVQEVLDQAQSEDDPDLLQSRLTGGALAMRKGQFVRATNTGTDLDPLIIGINVASATASDSWPRVLLVGSAAAADDPASVFIFSQENAQADYMLENWVRAVGGNSVRGVSVSKGTIALAPDATGFRLSPQQTLETYVKFLNDPDNKDYQVFDDNTFAPRYQEDLTTLNDAVEKAGKVTAKAKVDDAYPVTAVTLATGEALVATSFVYTHTYRRTVAGSTMSIGGTPATYVNDPDVIGTITVSYLVNIVFVIPPEGSDDNVRVVGSERVTTKVKKDDSDLPEGE